MAEEQKMTTALSAWTNSVTDMVVSDFSTNGVEFDAYAKECAMNSMSSIYQLVKSSGVAMNDIDTSNLREIVGQCASLKLNANGYPRECYFQLRKKKMGDKYVQTVEMGVEGAGQEALLRNYGVNVAQTYDWWIVKEGDEFIFPKRKGIETTPPEWEPKGLSQKTIRVVLPVKLNDGSVTYLISERESVKTNLFAHVRNNLMNETFGILKGLNAKGKPKTRYDATPEELLEIDARKEVIYKALRECETVEEMVKCEAAIPYISGAWIDTFESMVIRKMQNNAVKKFPKSFNNMAKESFIQIDETMQNVNDEIKENANTEIFVDAEVVESNGNEVFADVAP